MLLPPGRAAAFYSAGSDTSRLSLRGTVNAGLGYADYPDDNFLYETAGETVWNADLRLLFTAAAGDALRAEANILQNIRSTPTAVLPGRNAGVREVERSSLFFLQQHEGDDSQAFLALDSGVISLGGPSAELLCGRQPVNLSVTFYFTPNDFFAPFAPQDFYREYKPGVDALRFEKRLADLTQLTLLGVFGFAAEPDSDSGWSRAPNWQRTSLLGRLTHIAGTCELGLLGGILPDNAVLGVSLQGDLLPWLGIRAEGHYRNTWKEKLQDGLRLSVGLEHRFSARLVSRVEQMHNGTGYGSIGEADVALRAGTLRTGYLGRDYTALAASYEFTPLLTGEFLYLHNWTDSSRSFSFYGLYSLSDESEIALTLHFPMGEEPDRRSLHSEIGAAPVRVALEYRVYF
jgi:hypothetical protein